MKKTFLRFIVLLLVFATYACTDEELVKNGSNKGMARVELEVCFYPNHVSDLDTRTNGDAIDEIENLFVGFYSTEGDNALLYHYYYTPSTGLTITPLADREVGGDDLDPICKGTVKNVEIRSGQYHVIAVANMGDLDETHHDQIQYLEDIKKIQFPWRASIAQNNQMSGFFDTVRRADPPHTGDEPFTVTVNGGTRKLHAWLRRAASKVTVSFDNSELNPNVWIYIKSITLKDIPTSCKLVDLNKVENASDLTDGESLIIGEGDYPNFKSWPCITNGKNEYLSKYMGGDDPHARDSKASLFFYENMQGGGKDNGFKSKHQIDPDVEGASEFKPTWPEGYKPDNAKWKDCVECGTWVEVEAFYESQAGGNHAKGKIIYRFMLGKDVDYDYNAERNYHYKLTLVFKGNANDVDWHIEYKEEDGYWAPSPYYISYLYNKNMYLPIQTQGRVARIDAKIIENNWYASGETEDEQEDLDAYNRTMDQWGGYPVYWAGVWDYTSTVPRAPEEKYDCCFGFLSLRYEGERSIEMTNNEFNQNGKAATEGAPYIDREYHTHELYKRSYYNPYINNSNYTQFCNTSKGDKYYGEYIVEDETLNENPRHVFKIPFYTRALNLMTTTSYTGNNPFFNYVRKAKVRIRAYNEQGDLVTAYDPTTGERLDFVDVEIIQVRRIFNPKGIFRHATNDEQFHVVLKERKGDINDNGTPTTYEPTISHGAWTAKIVAGLDWIRIGKGPNPNSTRTIYGDTETAIDFYVKPAGTIAATAQRHGLIEVSYNNNTCFHTIVVKQGYAPTQVLGGRSSATPQARWSNFNMRSATEMCASPLEEGSMFRPGNTLDAIHPNNNWDAEVKSSKSTFKLYPSGSKSWKDIRNTTTGLSTSTECLFDNWTYADSYGTYHVAELQDFYYLRNDRETAEVSTDIDIAYGIVYGDGADSCQSDVDKAHGYKYTTANTSGAYPTSECGMRGCIVYNNGSKVASMAGNCVFFPSGVSGYGRRVDNSTSGTVGTEGRMRYSGGRGTAVGSPITSNMHVRPILHRLDLNMGMIYWHRRFMQTGLKGSSSGYALYTSSAWDFNMTTFDFNSYFNNANWDACYARMVLNTQDSKYIQVKVVNSNNKNTKCFPNYNY